MPHSTNITELKSAIKDFKSVFNLRKRPTNEEILQLTNWRDTISHLFDLNKNEELENKEFIKLRKLRDWIIYVLIRNSINPKKARHYKIQSLNEKIANNPFQINCTIFTIQQKIQELSKKDYYQFNQERICHLSKLIANLRINSDLSQDTKYYLYTEEWVDQQDQIKLWLAENQAISILDKEDVELAILMPFNEPYLSDKDAVIKPSQLTHQIEEFAKLTHGNHRFNIQGKPDEIKAVLAPSRFILEEKIKEAFKYM